MGKCTIVLVSAQINLKVHLNMLKYKVHNVSPMKGQPLSIPDF